MKAKALNILKFLVGWPLSIGALYFVWQMVSPKTGNFLEAFRNTNLILLSIGMLCFVLYYFIRSFIWYKLLQDKSYHIPYKQVNFLWAISEFKRYIPGKFWFILGRTVAFSNKGVAKKDTAKLLVVELEIFAISAVITSLLAVPEERL